MGEIHAHVCECDCGSRPPDDAGTSCIHNKIDAAPLNRIFLFAEDKETRATYLRLWTDKQTREHTNTVLMKCTSTPLITTDLRYIETLRSNRFARLWSTLKTIRTVI